MAFLGNSSSSANYVPQTDFFSGDGSTVAFTLSRAVVSAYQVEAVVANVMQNPSDAYTINGNVITFTSAPPAGTNNVYVRYAVLNTSLVAVGQGVVGATQVDGNYALWNKSGSDINYTAGNVCVGTTTALATAANRGNVTVNGSSGSIVAMGVGGATKGYLFQDSSTMYLVNSGGGATNVEVNGAARLSIDSSGRVTMPYQPAFQAYYTSNKTKAAGWNSLPLFDATKFNIGNHFNLANNRFTAPVTGTYVFYFGGFFVTGGTDRVAVEMYKNGSTYQAFGAPLCPGDSPWPISTVVVQLTAGDWFSQPAAYTPASVLCGSGTYSIILGGYLLG